MTSKVMLVDDHALFIEGLQYLLKTYGINVVGTVTDAGKVLPQARLLKPDIILMDIKMPECSGLDLLKLIKAEMPAIKIVMLTTSDDDEDLFDAVKYGASGYLLKNTSAKELVNMLSELEKGEVPLSPGLAIRLLKEFRHIGVSPDKFPQETTEEVHKGQLTKRQLEVLEKVAEGMTYKETGAILGLTERTVKYHMGRIIEQLHLEKRAQVIAYAARIGLIEDTKSK